MNQHFFRQALQILVVSTLSASCSTKTTKSSDYAGHGAESVSQETIQRFAPAELPKNLKARIESLLDLRSPGPGYLTQDQRKMFFEWSVSGTPHVWRLDGPRSFPIQMTGGSNATSLEGITPDGKWILISRDENGDEYSGIYLQSAEGGALKELFRKPKVQASVNLISDDSRSIIISANDIDPKSFAIHKIELATGVVETLHQLPGAWSAVDERNGVLLLHKAVTNIVSEYYELDLSTKKLKPVLGQNEQQDYFVQFGTRSGEYLVLTSRQGDFRRLYSWENGKWTPLSSELDAEVESFSIDRSRRRVVYTINDKGYSRLKAFDARTKKSISLPQFKDAEMVRLNQITRTGRSISVSVIRHDQPRQTLTWTWDTEELKQWTVPSQPETDSKKFVRAELEYYTARDGTKIPMFVRRPVQCRAGAATSPCPVVVQFHGGPEAQSRPGYSLTAQLFVDEGFIYVEPNVRGSSGYGRKWLDSDNGALRLKVITDIPDAADFIRNNWKVGGLSPRVGVMGGSYGGYSTLYAMTRFAGSYEVGVSSVGMSSLMTFLMNTAPYRRALRTPEYGDPEKDKEALIELSPITHLNKVSGSLLIIQGVNDPRVPAGESIQFFDAMRSKNLPASLILFADEGHGVSKRPNQVMSLGHTLLFFKKHLQ